MVMQEMDNNITSSTKGTYTDAMSRLAEIIRIIEQDAPDVDYLLQLGAEAKDLIGFCKQKLYAADQQIEELIASLDAADGGKTVSTGDATTLPEP